MAIWTLAVARSTWLSAAATVLLATTLPAAAEAAIVPVMNSSFEDPFTATFTPGALDGWTGTGDYGVFRPGAFPAAYGGVGTTDGAQVAYSNGGTISQVLTALLAPNTLYTLSVDVGNRLDLTFPGYSVGLYAGGVLLAESTSPTPPEGGYVTTTVNYSTAIGNPQIGQALEIRLVSIGGGQTNFDNVQLEAAEAPEPATIAVLGLGALGLVAGTWRRRKQTS